MTREELNRRLRARELARKRDDLLSPPDWRGGWIRYVLAVLISLAIMTVW